MGGEFQNGHPPVSCVVLREPGDSPVDGAWAYLEFDIFPCDMLAELEGGDIELLYIIGIMFQMQERFVIEVILGFQEKVEPPSKFELSRDDVGTRSPTKWTGCSMWTLIKQQTSPARDSLTLTGATLPF